MTYGFHLIYTSISYNMISFHYLFLDISLLQDDDFILVLNSSLYSRHNKLVSNLTLINYSYYSMCSLLHQNFTAMTKISLKF